MSTDGCRMVVHKILKLEVSHLMLMTLLQMALERSEPYKVWLFYLKICGSLIYNVRVEVSLLQVGVALTLEYTIVLDFCIIKNKEILSTINLLILYIHVNYVCTCVPSKYICDTFQFLQDFVMSYLVTLSLLDSQSIGTLVAIIGFEVFWQP